MVQTWKTEKGGGFTCPGCGSLYSVEYTRLPTRDSDKAICRVCGEVMDEWNSTTFPTYTLVERRDQKGGSE